MLLLLLFQYLLNNSVWKESRKRQERVEIKFICTFRCFYSRKADTKDSLQKFVRDEIKTKILWACLWSVWSNRTWGSIYISTWGIRYEFFSFPSSKHFAKYLFSFSSLAIFSRTDFDIENISTRKFYSSLVSLLMRSTKKRASIDGAPIFLRMNSRGSFPRSTDSHRNKQTLSSLVDFYHHAQS